MISVPAGARVLLATRPIDFRKGAHSLAALAQEVLTEDPFSGAVIVYRAKRSDRLKILVWDSSGLVLVWKQLQQGSRAANFSASIAMGRPPRRPRRRAAARPALTRSCVKDRSNCASAPNTWNRNSP
jgi:hypothetical protein